MAGYRLILALAALAVSLSMWHWRRRSRAEWQAYDAQYHGDDNPLRPSGAARRAQGADRDRDGA